MYGISGGKMDEKNSKLQLVTFQLGEELYGMKNGEEKDIEVTLPENYPDKKYASKKAMFKVKTSKEFAVLILENFDDIV